MAAAIGIYAAALILCVVGFDIIPWQFERHAKPGKGRPSRRTDRAIILPLVTLMILAAAVVLVLDNQPAGIAIASLSTLVAIASIAYAAHRARPTPGTLA
jgi:accessory gene regulator protein AgrB